MSSINRVTCVADHSPPRAVGMPRSFNPAAMARNDVAPANNRLEVGYSSLHMLGSEANTTVAAQLPPKG
jgi:hypothetical protein